MYITELKNKVLDNKEFRSIPFWSWNNEIDEKNLLSQIEDMKKAGIGGFIMHARIGLKTDYLGDKWWSCIEACLKKAKELDMEAWVYDENGWPSGFVGGKLLEKEEYRAQFLEYKILDKFDEKAFAVYKLKGGNFKLIENAQKGVKRYHTIYLKTSPANTDILNPKVVDAFIKETHEKYYEKFKDSFGKELVGFFTDEPQYYRWGTPYTKMLEKEFAKNGKNVKDGLIYLFVKGKKGYSFRYDYFSALNKLYINNYYKKIYDWCTAHNCKLTGHSIEESGIALQLMCCAGVSPSYEFEHIPAIDQLGRDCRSDLMPKQIGSVASQLDKKYVLTETFACCGYEVTPKELKSVADYQIFNGVNKICQHLYPYSISAQGKSDHPPIFSKQSGWFDEFKDFNDYLANVGYIVGNTKEIVDVAVIHPLKGGYLNFIKQEETTCLADYEAKFDKLIKTLNDNGVTYHLVDETILSRHGKVKDGKLVVGKCAYEKVIVPDMMTIAKSTCDILSNFNGKLCLINKLKFIDGVKAKVKLKSNLKLNDVIADTKIKFKALSGKVIMTARESDLGRFIFIKNYVRKEGCSFEFEDYKNYKAIDLNTFKLKEIEKTTKLDGAESIILYKTDEQGDKKLNSIEGKSIKNNFVCSKMSENSLVLDYASYSKDGEKYTSKKPVQQIFEELLREDYKGEIFVKQTFNVKDIVPAKLLCERAKYKTFKLNGKDVKLVKSDFDFLFDEANLTDLIKKGENTIIYSIDFYEHDGVHFALFDPLATESLRNCLYYDTSIENLIIKGDFALDSDFAICGKKGNMPFNNLVDNGYPFFNGSMEFEGKVSYDGDENVDLAVFGDYLVANVYVNGEKIDYLFTKHQDITSLLKVGENDVKVVIKSSLRNLFGPFHFAPDLKAEAVSPFNFTMRGTWVNGKSEFYTDAYGFARFGVDDIVLTKLK